MHHEGNLKKESVPNFAYVLMFGYVDSTSFEQISSSTYKLWIRETNQLCLLHNKKDYCRVVTQKAMWIVCHINVAITIQNTVGCRFIGIYINYFEHLLSHPYHSNKIHDLVCFYGCCYTDE